MDEWQKIETAPKAFNRSRTGEAGMSEEQFHELCLAKWREREMNFIPRVRRLEPDDLDRASGTRAKFVADCRKAEMCAPPH